MKYITVFVLTLLSVLFAAGNASADFVFDLTTSNGDFQKDHTGPYLHVDVHLVDPTHATITANGLSGYRFGGTNGFSLSVNASSFGAAVSSFLPVSKDDFTTIIRTTKGGAQGELGTFDVTFGQQNSSKPVSELIVDLWNTSGTWSGENNVLTFNDKGFYAGAHIMAGNDTGYAAGSPSAVPIPGGLLLLAPGLLGLVAIRTRLKRRGLCVSFP